MIVSKKWLDTFFREKLPPAQVLADTLLLHAFEIEGVEERNGDTILDIDVLPNRAHDSLSHRGVARELATLLNLPLREERYTPHAFDTKTKTFRLRDESNGACKRYIAVRLDGVRIGESPDWIKNRLETIGQRSINNLVDATNYVLFDLGQPLHVFDADKVVGGITVRFAREGEEMELLGGGTISLHPEDLVIADDEGPLALAGVKGGTKAEIDENTENIIIEAANFDPIRIRKTARRHKLATDASKRYENGITSELAWEGANAMLSLLEELAAKPSTTLWVNPQGFPYTEFYPEPEENAIISLRQEHVQKVLGFPISSQEIEEIFRKLRFRYVSEGDGTYRVVVPHERLDLRIPEDLIEEIGRIYGYDKIPVESLDSIPFDPQVNESFFREQELRNFFLERGFSELMNYTFTEEGELRVLNPLQADRNFLRAEMEDGMEEALEKNTRYADFMNLRRIRVFEFDHIHRKDSEETYVSFAIRNVSKREKKEFGTEEEQREALKEELRRFCRNEEIPFQDFEKGTSFPLSACRIELPEDLRSLLEGRSYSDSDVFHPISPFPYIRRDVSFWAPEGMGEEAFLKAVNELSLENLKRVYHTDEFTKEGRTSHTFSLFFQAPDRTLTDEEVNRETDKVYNWLREQGAEVR